MKRLIIAGLMLCAPQAWAAAPFKSVSAQEVLRRQQTESAKMMLIDCRTRTDYKIEHIAGAVSIPLFELGFLPLPKDKDLILYCHGDGCNISLQGAKKLRGLGYKRISVMTEGLVGWKKHGYPVEATARTMQARYEKR